MVDNLENENISKEVEKIKDPIIASRAFLNLLRKT